MLNNFDTALQFVLREEGLFSDNPKDPGGATKYGCTKRTWEAWVGHEVTVDVIRNLKVSDVAPLYKEKYWDACKCSELPNGVDLCVFDMAINSGPTRAIKTLQSCLNIGADGVIGPGTILVAKSKDTAKLIDSFCGARHSYLISLPTFDTFGRGWTRRVLECGDKALSMV